MSVWPWEVFYSARRLITEGIYVFSFTPSHCYYQHDVLKVLSIFLSERILSSNDPLTKSSDHQRSAGASFWLPPMPLFSARQCWRQSGPWRLDNARPETPRYACQNLNASSSCGDL